MATDDRKYIDLLIADRAAKHGLPPELLHSVVRQESGYNPNAKSPAGAMGLMQLMPGTAAGLGVKNAYDPADNLEGGARYLKQQIDKFGDVSVALAAYNAGPGAVQKYGGIPPYKETQNYVKSIMAQQAPVVPKTKKKTEDEETNRAAFSKLLDQQMDEFARKHQEEIKSPPKTKISITPATTEEKRTQATQIAEHEAFLKSRPGYYYDYTKDKWVKQPDTEIPKPEFIPGGKIFARKPTKGISGQASAAKAATIDIAEGTLIPKAIHKASTIGPAYEKQLRERYKFEQDMYIGTMPPYEEWKKEQSRYIPGREVYEKDLSGKLGEAMPTWPGELVGALGPIGGAQATLGRLGLAGLKKLAPKVAAGTGKLAKLAQLEAQMIPTGAAYSGGTAALEQGATPADVARGAALGATFFGAGVPAGRQMEKVIRRAKPELTRTLPGRIATGALRGATTGAVGAAAGYPLYPEKPAMGELAKGAGELALFDAVMSMFTKRPALPRFQKALPAHGERLMLPTTTMPGTPEIPKFTGTEPESGTRVWPSQIDEPGITVKTEPAGPLPGELVAARNLLHKGGLSFSKAARILETYPELKAQFPAIVKKIEQLGSKLTTSKLKVPPATTEPPGPPIDDRTFDEVGSRKMKAYQWEHPELAPYIQDEAARLFAELQDSVKGERVSTTDTLTGERVFTGTKRYVSEPIQQIMQQTGASYKEITDALNRIIKDEGAENQALAKRIELIIDDNLSQGTKTLEGLDIESNQEYLILKSRLKKPVTQKAPPVTQKAREEKVVPGEEVDWTDIFEPESLEGRHVDIRGAIAMPTLSELVTTAQREIADVRKLPVSQVDGIGNTDLIATLARMTGKLGVIERYKALLQEAIDTDTLPENIVFSDMRQGKNQIAIRGPGGKEILVGALRIRGAVTKEPVVRGMPAQQPAAGITPLQQLQQAIRGQQPVGTPQSRVEIMRKIEKDLLVPIRNKRMWHRFRGGAGRAIGQYQEIAEVIRLRNPEDLPTLAHEVGHHLVKFVGLDARRYPELQALGARLYPKSPDIQHNEGFAEFFRLYFTKPAAAARHEAPSFYRDLEALLAQEKPVHITIKEIQKQYQAWYTQSDMNHVMGVIVSDEARNPRNFLSTSERFYADWKDDLHSIWKYVKEVSGASDISILKNPYELARLARGRIRKALVLMNRMMITPDGRVIGKSLRGILKPVRKDIKEFTGYLVAKRAIELHGRDIKTGIDPQRAIGAAIEFDQQFPYFKDTQRDLMKYQDNVLSYLVDAGVLSGELAIKFRLLNQYYVPFYRYFGEEAATKGFTRGTGQKWADLPQPIKGIKGSSRSIIDPLESIYKNTVFFIDIAERNRVGRAVAELADKAVGKGWLIERLPSPVAPTKIELERLEKDLLKAGIPKDVLEAADLERVATIFNPVRYARFKEKQENILTVYRGGKPIFYQCHPELYRSLQMMDAEAADWFIKLLSVPASTLRKGAVLNPEFIMRNPFRDQLTAFIQSKYGYVPVVDLIRGMYHVIGRTELYALWEHSGGAQATLTSLDRNYLQGQVRRLLGARTVKEKAALVARSPLEILARVSEAMEEATRVGEFRKGVLKEGRTRAGIAKAALSSREVTLDFQRAGFKGRKANRMIAFFNAALEGPDQLKRTFRENPVRATILATIGITLPSIALYLNNYDDPRYQELPRWRKDLYWVICGEDKLYFIPKPFEAGVIFGSFFERALGAMNEKNPKEFSEWAKSMATILSPGIIPNAFIPYFEAAWGPGGYSFFTKRPIVPMREQRLEPPEQYGPHTSEAAKAIGSVANVSPRKAEHLVRGYTGGLGMHALGLMDLLSGEAFEKSPWYEASPFVKAFAGAPYRSPASVEDFYDRLEKVEKRFATYKERKARGEYPGEKPSLLELKRLRRVADRMSDERQKIRKIQSSKLTAEQKREKVSIIDVKIVNLARKARWTDKITVHQP